MKHGCVIALAVKLIVTGYEEKVNSNEPAGFLQIKGSDTMVNTAQMVCDEFMLEV
jgi:hypothetical protein